LPNGRCHSAGRAHLYRPFSLLAPFLPSTCRCHPPIVVIPRSGGDEKNEARSIAAISVTETMENADFPAARRHRRPGKVPRLKACQRCHIRRIRCDASVIGTPCSNCQKARVQDCSIIESRRLRQVPLLVGACRYGELRLSAGGLLGVS
jgi:hypothetical protein